MRYSISVGITLTVLYLLTALAVVPASAADEADHDIVDTVVASGYFKTLVRAIGTAGLGGTLKGAGPFTLFAPTDEAFDKLPPGKLDALLKDRNALTAVLTYHVVPGRVAAADVVKRDTVRTVQGQLLRVASYGHKVKVNDAQVIRADIECANGIIHVVDAVLLPPAG